MKGSKKIVRAVRGSSGGRKEEDATVLGGLREIADGAVGVAIRHAAAAGAGAVIAAGGAAVATASAPYVAVRAAKRKVQGETKPTALT